MTEAVQLAIILAIRDQVPSDGFVADDLLSDLAEVCGCFIASIDDPDVRSEACDGFAAKVRLAAAAARAAGDYPKMRYVAAGPEGLQ